MESSDSEELDQEKRDLADKLTSYLNDHSDEIPEQILHGGGLFKVRISWWTGIIGRLWLALDFIRDPLVKAECEKFLNKYAGTDYWNDCTNRTTREDIEYANRVVTDVIKDLS
ncbi:MAG: hypothetical protein Q8P62_00610 [Candidatus Peregrinibacteria bacterium]|nr:hypothetical protein [Candidatus Peregrinibacteria bacterium]